MSEDELARFTELNTAYRSRFGFPFIMAVKGKTKGEISAEFVRRLDNDAPTEFATALDQINRIAAFRIKEILS